MASVHAKIAIYLINMRLRCQAQSTGDKVEHVPMKGLHPVDITPGAHSDDTDCTPYDSRCDTAFH